MKNKNVIKFSIYYLFMFVALSIPFAYMQTYLEWIGYDVVERGVILSMSALVAIVTQFIIGYICDRYKTNRIPLNVTLIAMVIAAVVMYRVSEYEFFVHFFFVSLMAGLFRTVMAVQDAWTLEVDEQCRKHYGFIRALGAVGWMIGTPMGAWLISKYGYGILGYVFAALSLITILYSFILEEAKKFESESNLKVKDLKILFESNEYITVVMIFFFINVISTADIYTTVDKMMMLGANETLIGARWSIQAFVELPLFFAGAFLLKRFGDVKLLMFGTAMYILRFIGYAIVQTPELIIIVTCLQCVTFPLIMITSKTLVAKVTPEHLKSSGQTVATSIYSGIPLLITPIIASLLIKLVDIDMTLLLLGSLGVIPLYLVSTLRSNSKFVD